MLEFLVSSVFWPATVLIIMLLLVMWICNFIKNETPNGIFTRNITARTTLELSRAAAITTLLTTGDTVSAECDWRKMAAVPWPNENASVLYCDCTESLMHSEIYSMILHRPPLNLQQNTQPTINPSTDLPKTEAQFPLLDTITEILLTITITIIFLILALTIIKVAQEMFSRKKNQNAALNENERQI